MSTVVVGAGLAGLAAARKLQAGGEEVIVLEAATRVGGRTRTERDRLRHGQPADLGGSFIDLGQDRILRACAEFGVKLTPTINILKPGPDGRVDLSSVLRNTVVAEGRLLTPEECAKVADEVRAALDASPPVATESIASWTARAGLSPLARRLVRAQAGANPVHEPEETQMSMIHPPHSGKTCWMIPGGADSLATAMAEGLDVRFEQAVQLIRQDQETFEITVKTATDEFTAANVIVTTPVTATRGIAFDPVLPEWKLQALVTTPMSQGGKVAGQYANGAELRSRLGASVTSDGPISFAWAGPVSEQDTVVVYGLAPDLSDGFLRDERRALDALDDLIRIATGAEAERIAGVLQDWTREPYAGGVVSNLMADFPRLPALLARAVGWGMIHFAGEHTADNWVSSMEGALRSGDRAADEVLLQRSLTPAG
ncbi:NAD(P)/FAD-dependent oxidoreductase [Streptomyces sp. NPDC006197]|uniref:flavin monoamine oxidase family protein n=1 Tax=Streptomyces sp. NPDC006197 TaxID=3156685 RepID=UPI0033A43E98